MKGPPDAPSEKVDIPAEAFDGMKVSKFEMEQVESEDEKALRL